MSVDRGKNKSEEGDCKFHDDDDMLSVAINE
jgi:hypothetical protein